MLSECFIAFQIVKILIFNKADLSIANKDGWTAFHVAARAGSLDVLKELYKSNPNSVSTVSSNGRTPVHTAALAGHVEVVQFILNECGQEVKYFIIFLLNNFSI